MSGERISDFLVQIQTSSPPTPVTPSSGTDVLTLSYSDSRYAKRSALYEQTLTVAGIRAIASADRAHGQLVFLDGGTIYWFHSTSTAIDDGDTTLQPNSGSGRWLKLASSSSGGGGVAIESLEQVAQARQFGVKMKEHDFSVLEALDLPSPTVEGFLLENYTASSTSMTLAWNPKFLDTTNKNSDFDAAYTGVTGTSTANLDTEPTNKSIGASANSWDKTSGTVNSFIQKDLGAGLGISLAANRTALVLVWLPSLTGLSKVSMRLSADAANPANYVQCDVTTQFDGTALIAGKNYLLFDFVNGTLSTTGTGFAIATQLMRTFAIGVVTSSTSQTYTNISFDGLVFEADSGETVARQFTRIGQKGMQYTIADTSNIEHPTISAASTYAHFKLTLAAGLSNSYSGGTSSVVMRSTIGLTGNNRTNFQSSSPLTGGTLNSGASDLKQVLRRSRIFRESLTASTFTTTACLLTQLFFDVISAGGTTVTVVDTVDYHLQMLSGAKLHVVTFFDHNGRRSFSYANDITLTANSSNTSSVTTFTVSSGDATSVSTAMAAGSGAMLIKQGQLDVFFSLVAATANESFGSAMTPDKIQINDVGIPYPGGRNVYGHWNLGSPTGNQSESTRNNFGSGLALTVNGTIPNYQRDFKNGFFASGPFTTSNYFSITNPAALDPDTTKAGLISFSIWAKFLALSGDEVMMSMNPAGDGGWHVRKNTSDVLVLRLAGVDKSSGITAVANQYYHVAGWIEDNTTTAAIYVNNVKTSFSGISITSGNTADFQIGANTALSKSCNAYLAQALTQSNYKITDADVSAIFNGGFAAILGFYPGVQIHYKSTGVSGQKASVRADLSRTTNAIESYVAWLGSLKTA